MMTTRVLRHIDRRPIVVGLVALLLASGLVVRNLVETDWNPTTFVAFGEDAPITLAYGHERLADLDARSDLGHDGKFFFVQANDPLLLEPESNAAVLDRPLYRSQRALYPLLAGGFGVFPPVVIVWSMIGLNVLALGVGSWAAALVARSMGGSAWWGLSFGLNVGLLSEMLVGGAGAVAAALVVGAVALIHRGNGWASIALLAAAALTREVMLVSAAGLAWFFWRRGERTLARLSILLPLATVGGWALYLRSRLGWDGGTAEVEEFGAPLSGMISAFDHWLDSPADLLGGVAMVMVLVLFARRMWSTPSPIGWAAVGFLPIAVLLTEQVWLNYFDITRALALVITSFLLMAFATRTPAPADRGSADAGLAS